MYERMKHIDDSEACVLETTLLTRVLVQIVYNVMAHVVLHVVDNHSLDIVMDYQRIDHSQSV